MRTNNRWHLWSWLLLVVCCVSVVVWSGGVTNGDVVMDFGRVASGGGLGGGSSSLPVNAFRAMSQISVDGASSRGFLSLSAVLDLGSGMGTMAVTDATPNGTYTGYSAMITGIEMDEPGVYTGQTLAGEWTGDLLNFGGRTFFDVTSYGDADLGSFVLNTNSRTLEWTINSVDTIQNPLPAALWFGLALGGLIGVGRKFGWLAG